MAFYFHWSHYTVQKVCKPKKTTSDTICFIAHVGLKEGEAIGEESVKVQAYLYRAVVSD